MTGRSRSRAAARAVVGALALSLLGPGCNSSNDAGPPVPVDPTVLYTQMCVRCHGVDGRGDPVLRKQMPIRDFADPQVQGMRNEDIERVIMAGRNQMPGFGASLSLPKTQSITGYVRRLGGGGRDPRTVRGPGQ